MAVPSPLSRRLTVAALLTLTAVTGLVDAVSYLRLGHVFVANMTGNVVFLGFTADPHSGLSLAASLTAIGGFVVGALAGGRAAHTLAATRPRRCHPPVVPDRGHRPRHCPRRGRRWRLHLRTRIPRVGRRGCSCIVAMTTGSPAYPAPETTRVRVVCAHARRLAPAASCGGPVASRLRFTVPRQGTR